MKLKATFESPHAAHWFRVYISVVVFLRKLLLLLPFGILI